MPSPTSVVLALLMLSTTCLAQPSSCNEKSFCVGAAKAEITAPPGFPTGGHGPAGNYARGSWSRNWARAFVIKDPKGILVVLVSCDTFAVPLSLTSEVWASVHKDLERQGLTLKPEQLLISATHTHQGAGNYMDAPAYNAFGSVKGGFSKPLFNYLVGQVSDAVMRAAGKMRPAELRLYHGKIETPFDKPFLVNRSPATFAHNFDAKEVLNTLGDFGKPDKPCPEQHMPGEPEDGWDLGGCPRLRAVDRRMVILKATDISSSQRIDIANLVFFAVHPTVLIHHAPLFNSDFTGYAMDMLESDNPMLVAGFFNGAEGDITARRVNRDVLEVVERGKELLKQIHTVLKNGGEPQDPTIVVKARLIDTRSSTDRICGNHELADTPYIGAAQPGGAELDRTIFFDFGFRTGVRSFKAANNQGNKQAALDLKDFPGVDLLTRLIGAFLSFPRSLSVTYVKIGNFSLGAVPLEVSTTAGYRIRKDMESTGEVFQLLGLTNGYASYAATASEYAAQDYMGASTLWGPQQAEFFRCQLAKLKDGIGDPQFHFPDVPWKLGKNFDAKIVGEKRDLPDEELEEIIRDEYRMPVRQLPFFEWTEQVSSRDVFKAASKRRFCVTTKEGEVIDKSDFGFIKILRRAPSGHSQLWSVIWLGPLLGPVPKVQFVFHVTTSNNVTLRSALFEVDLDSSRKPLPVGQAGTSSPCK